MGAVLPRLPARTRARNRVLAAYRGGRSNHPDQDVARARIVRVLRPADTALEPSYDFPLPARGSRRLCSCRAKIMHFFYCLFSSQRTARPAILRKQLAERHRTCLRAEPPAVAPSVSGRVCDSVRDLPVTSASTSRIAFSRARRSLVMSVTKNTGSRSAIPLAGRYVLVRTGHAELLRCFCQALPRHGR